MEENDAERREIIHTFYRLYRQIQKQDSLREHTHFDICGNNLIEIWERGRVGKDRLICKIKEETETECYRKAIEYLKDYGGKETTKHGKRAG